MREIRIPDRPQKGKVKDLEDSSDSGFEVRSIEEVSAPADSDERPVGEKVKVRFDKFVQLVATHSFDEILEQNKEEEIVMSSNLLMDLANAHEDTSTTDKKTPTIFAVGLILGVAFAYILFKFF